MSDADCVLVLCRWSAFKRLYTLGVLVVVAVAFVWVISLDLGRAVVDPMLAGFGVAGLAVIVALVSPETWLELRKRQIVIGVAVFGGRYACYRSLVATSPEAVVLREYSEMRGTRRGGWYMGIRCLSSRITWIDFGRRRHNLTRRMKELERLLQ